jgi:hypothetical protein
MRHKEVLKDNKDEQTDCKGTVELRKSRMFWDDVFWDIYQCTACGATLAACKAPWWNHTLQEYFSKAEALSKVGKTVKTLSNFSIVPRDTTGVVQPFEDDDYKTLGIQWQLPQKSKLLKDWFSKTEYLKYLEEIEEENNG